ncbi:SGNH/GDSL hydrolase family protein [Actinoplanes couchii]|uniref:Lipase 1 n=1 Tax=Actinoplanes couchii TaxID=403638 RepID=A0ABQ3X7L5_9ACTN|nr:SGNH/GDSL hydrolase family protein [Actinoplanes couchii]MDR6322308.1 lysophospholipase L1-like esterase [Actinoplanes couchii]GID54467.1 lipase 1 [Actinoplanes couchii]
MKARQTTAALLFAVALGVSGCGGGGEAEQDAATKVVATDFVALGDSYAAGLGAGNYGDDKQCRQSRDGGYPQLFAKEQATPFTKVTDVACSGAVINDVRYKQLPALTETTGVVTLTVGGNDAGWTGSLQDCLFGDDAGCATSVETSVKKAEGTLPAALDDLYKAIRTAAPNAKVYVLGYPHLVAEPGKSGVTCQQLNDARRKSLNEGADSLVDLIKGRAEAQEGFTFVDVREAFKGHEACTKEPWIHAVGDDISETFHPNADGYQAYLKALVAAA